MHTIAYLFRRKPGLSREEFISLYESHREVMLGAAKGLVSYEQYPTRTRHDVGDVYSNAAYGDFDALSIYTYHSAEDADYTTLLPAVIEDSQRFIDFDTMISLAANKHVIL
jgi:hypothetical protein